MNIGGQPTNQFSGSIFIEECNILMDNSRKQLMLETLCHILAENSHKRDMKKCQESYINVRWHTLSMSTALDNITL